MDIPMRLGKGKGIVGPDHFGCINTGLAPGLLRSEKMADFPSLFDGCRFAVGPVAYINDAIMERARRPRARSVSLNERRTVYFYRTYKAAKARYKVLCDEVRTANERARQEVEQARATLRAAGPAGLVTEQGFQAAMVLADHGVAR